MSLRLEGAPELAPRLARRMRSAAAKAVAEALKDDADNVHVIRVPAETGVRLAVSVDGIESFVEVR